MQKKNMKIIVPNEVWSKEVVVKTVCEFAKQLNPTMENLADIKTAVCEAMNNCINFAYPETTGTIYISCEVLKDNVLNVIIKDKGVGIANVDWAMQPLKTTDSTKAGMGFSVMQAFMDCITVSSESGKGTKVTMKKKI